MRTNKQIEASHRNDKRALFDSPLLQFQPASERERYCVEQMAIARRRLRSADRRALEDLLVLKTAKLPNEPNSPQNQEAA